ncbi:hypothetical protein PAPYR_11253 [Paratrimastix pyriformis]|uniref:Uncharacterized protein n=1 Tax=Paratrimastix pyriformis TaxID=342808 RepID=A0ABQ8U8E5_9EUKA|nr:hypothetical protein PAPYR_11253 [Paratrimastix pyriformis]
MGSLPIPRALSVTHLAHQHQCSVFFFGVGLRLPMTITPTLGPLCDFSAYLLVYVPHRGFSHEGAPLDFRMPLCLGVRAIRGMFGCGARGYTNTGKIGAMHLRGLHLFMPRVMLDVSCLLSHRLMPSCLSEAVTALGTFGERPRTHAGDTVECVPPLSCLMLVLALRHAHSQHQDGYP